MQWSSTLQELPRTRAQSWPGMRPKIYEWRRVLQNSPGYTGSVKKLHQISHRTPPNSGAKVLVYNTHFRIWNFISRTSFWFCCYGAVCLKKVPTMSVFGWSLFCSLNFGKLKSILGNTFGTFETWFKKCVLLLLDKNI